MAPNMVLSQAPFWFMRHGETDWNRDGLIQGSADIPLNAAGRAQAEAACGKLAGRGITAVWSSPLQRARATAEIVAASLGLSVVVEPGLREASFGVHEGEVIGDWFTAWAAENAVPEGGESFAALGVRAVAAMNVVLAGGGLPFVVAHGGFFRAVRGVMGFATTVRTANGVPVLCAADAKGWSITPAEDVPRG
jgi:broad specificity phosphatase PhoE